jgi:hypothetical protein
LQKAWKNLDLNSVPGSRNLLLVPLNNMISDEVREAAVFTRSLALVRQSFHSEREQAYSREVAAVLSGGIESMCSAWRTQQAEVMARMALKDKLDGLLMADERFLNSRLFVFGSSGNGLALRDADVDLCMMPRDFNAPQVSLDGQIIDVAPSVGVAEASSSVAEVESRKEAGTEEGAKTSDDDDDDDDDDVISNPETGELSPEAQLLQQFSEILMNHRTPSHASASGESESNTNGDGEEEEKGGPLSFDSFELVVTARVPVLKFREVGSGIECDICVGNSLAVFNTALLATYQKIDPRVQPLLLAVKHWTKQRKVRHYMCV